jgi:hypothetical protein
MLMDENAKDIGFVFTWEKIYVVADFQGYEPKLSWYDAETQAFGIQFIYIAVILAIYCFHKDNKIDQLEERFI